MICSNRSKLLVSYSSYSVFRMNQEKIDFTWNTYKDHLQEMLHNMMTSKELTDVTLVSEDKILFKAHKVVLSASSTVFKSIISENFSTNPVIYLRGILSYEIKPILQFIYLGKATFYHDRINDFFQVGKSLEIKEINRDIGSYDYEQINTENHEFENPIKLSEHTDPLQLKSIITSKQGIMKSNQYNTFEHDSMFSCDQCDKQYAHRSALNQHKKSIHEGVMFPCDQCKYKANQFGHLQTHIISVHEKVKYPCDQCNYKASESKSLKNHKKSVHDGVKYNCEECNFKAAFQSALSRHKKRFHDTNNITN